MPQIPLSQVDAKSRQEWRPHFALLFNQAAGGANSQAILAVWYAWITRESGKTIHGNNPLNLTCSKGDGCYKGQIGWYQFPGNSRKFAAFATPQDGAQAVAGVLTVKAYRYPPILAAARRDDAFGMIDAITHSCWVSCNHIAYGGTLQTTWNQMRNLVAKDVADGTIGKLPEEVLGAFGDLVSFPVGHTLTQADVDQIMATLESKGWFDVGFGTTGKTVGMNIVRAILEKHIGDVWSKALQDQLQQEFNAAAGLAGTAFNPTAQGGPLEGIGSALQTLVAIAQKLLDPQTYIRTGALIVGLILLFTGFKMLMDATSGTPVAG